MWTMRHPSGVSRSTIVSVLSNVSGLPSFVVCSSLSLPIQTRSPTQQLVMGVLQELCIADGVVRQVLLAAALRPTRLQDQHVRGKQRFDGLEVAGRQRLAELVGDRDRRRRSLGNVDCSRICGGRGVMRVLVRW